MKEGEEPHCKENWNRGGGVEQTRSFNQFFQENNGWQLITGHDWLRKAAAQNTYRSCCPDARQNYGEAQSTELSRAKWRADNKLFPWKSKEHLDQFYSFLTFIVRTADHQLPMGGWERRILGDCSLKILNSPSGSVGTASEVSCARVSHSPDRYSGNSGTYPHPSANDNSVPGGPQRPFC